MKVQEAYRTSNKSKLSPHHIIIKTQNIQNKERIFKVAKENGLVAYIGRPTKIKTEFSMKTMKARRSCIDVLQTLKDANPDYYTQNSFQLPLM